jgi:rSAM/selenodomain-associated transferase 1
MLGKTCVHNGLIIFAREPLPGMVKTRLAASIGDRLAAEQYEAMLREVLSAAHHLTDVATVVYWNCDASSLPLLSGRYRCRSRLQCQGDLGERMQAAFAEMFADGSTRCCIIGSDAPDLPLSYLRDAYRLMTQPQIDVVLGPSKDGGYYLLGLKQVVPQLFRDIFWSSAAVCSQTLSAASDCGLTVTLLPEWQDIDTLEDLQDYQKRNCHSRVREYT